jgi:hypothetical protein
MDDAIGQLLWLTFLERERQLDEAELYNEASRGPLGALKLLWRRKGRLWRRKGRCAFE